MPIAGSIRREIMTNDLIKLRALFLKYLTQDSKTQDARRKEYNQAIFFDLADKHFSGHQVFHGTNLKMVMKKFDRAVKEFYDQIRDEVIKGDDK